jgi:circadian clock protein KaiC
VSDRPAATDPIDKLPIGIAGFDLIALGGLPKGRTTLVVGSAGSAKTVFAAQFLAEGIARGEPGVFVTFEEPARDVRRNMLGFGWDVAGWEADGRWIFVDASPRPEEEAVVVGAYDMGGLLARIEHAVRTTGAERVAMDSLGAVFARFADTPTVRRELFRVVSTLRELGVTAVMTAERVSEHGEISRFGVEEFVADNVVILRNALEDEKRRRTIEILKFRGTAHQKGEYPFTISSGAGIMVLPLSAMELGQRSSNVRITSGVTDLDEMCGGGFFRDSIILVSGATGTGKTLMVTEFVEGGAAAGERCLLFAFEESREQLARNATGWGVDFDAMEREGKLRVVCSYPENCGLEEHLLRMRNTIEEFRPHRVAVDSLSALERVSSIKTFREFVIGLTSFMKEQEVAGLFTSTTPTLMGGESITEAHISTITDSIILLRYVETFGEMRRGLTVLKMRGSRHDKDIREFAIDGDGMHIGKPFRDVTGIVAGHPVHLAAGEVERIGRLFADGPDAGT